MNRRRRSGSAWVAPAALFGVILMLYLSTVDLDGASNDVHSSSVASWRIATTGQPWLEGVDLNQTGAPTETLWVGEAPNGHRVVFRSPGVIAAGIPGYLLLPGETSPAGFSLVPEVATAAVLTTVACLFFFLSVRDRIPRPAALAATGVLALATPMWTVAGDQLWTHSVTVLGIAGMGWAAHRDRWWLVGLFGGVALWGRLHTAVIVAILGLGVAVVRRSPRTAVQVGSVSGAMLGLATVWTHWMYGTWHPAGGYFGSDYVGRSTTGGLEAFVHHLENQLGLWVSFDRGFLVWSPVLLLLLPALARSWRLLPDWTRWLALGGLVYVFIQGQMNAFGGGTGLFGYRLTLELLVAVAPAFALSVAQMGRWARLLVGPVIGAQAAVMSVGAMSNALFIEKEDAWTDNSFWLAMRESHVFSWWLGLLVLMGWLVSRVWLERTTVRADESQGYTKP